MLKNIGTVILVFSIAGCGGESSKDSGSGDGGSSNNKSASATTPDGKKPAGKPDGAGNKARVDGVFSARKNMEDMNKLKQIAIGLHNHHDVYRQFPFAPLKTGKKRNENLSWRIAILPFLELVGEFDKFDVTQPWDSEQNKPLANGPGKEAFTLSNGNLVCGIKHEKPPVGLRNIIDGSSNTIMLLENPNGKSDQWTQPVDLTPEEAIKLIKSLKKGEFLIGAFFDGSTRKLYSMEGKDIKDSDLMVLFDYKDGQPINDEVFFPGK